MRSHRYASHVLRKSSSDRPPHCALISVNTTQVPPSTPLLQGMLLDSLPNSLYACPCIGSRRFIKFRRDSGMDCADSVVMSFELCTHTISYHRCPSSRRSSRTHTFRVSRSSTAGGGRARLIVRLSFLELRSSSYYLQTMPARGW